MQSGIKQDKCTIYLLCEVEASLHNSYNYSGKISANTGNLILVVGPWRKAMMYASTSAFDGGFSVEEGNTTSMPSSWGDQSLQLMTVIGVLLVLISFGDEAASVKADDAMT